MDALHDPALTSFASDNYSGVHPEVLAAVALANGGHQVSYGEDVYTGRLQEVFADLMGRPVEVAPVFNGTGANVVGLSAMLPRWGAVVCAETAHVHCDEGGAPERVGHFKLLTVPTPDGKLTPELVDRQAWGFGDEHRAQPLVVSITQSTELGTVYTPAEIKALADHAHSLGMRLHLDGARISNAVASLGSTLREVVGETGVDVMSFGGTKNGMLGGEAVIVVRPEAAVGITYVRKLSMQLPSKMRFVSAQLLALLEDDLWLRSAGHANAMASRLADGIQGLPGVELVHPVQANALFVKLGDDLAATLRTRFRFYDWDTTGTRRWMCSFDTTEEQVDAFAAAVREVAGQGATAR